MIRRHLLPTGALLALFAAPLASDGLAEKPSGKVDPYFKIEVVDRQTGRGVPLVELRTVHHVTYQTDSNGIVAFYEPGLMGQTVFFHVEGHGYEFPQDGFGFRGKALDVIEGGSARLAVDRINVAERLYRVTGGGIYRDSVLTGHPVPTRQPVLNGRVLGCDSVQNAVFGGKIHWFWGDTNRPGYPLGNFHVPGATSLLPGQGGLDPELGVDLEYDVDDNGFAKETARMPGDGPTWISGVVALTDRSGRERLFAGYAKIRPPMEAYRRGLVEFDPARQRFDEVLELDLDAPILPEGHALKHRVDGVDYVYFGDPFPLVRVAADAESLLRPPSYQAYTCLKEGSRVEVDRAADGTLRYGWRSGAPPITPSLQRELVESGRLKADEARPRLADVATGKPVFAHRGSVCWNAFRRRFVMIATELGGSRSNLGEVWYAEADAPEGPWSAARKIVTHDRYSFYNPKQHPYLAKEGGRVIFFEGTYVTSFSGNPNPTPRYDYNQIMYKLDLSDPRLDLPMR